MKKFKLISGRRVDDKGKASRLSVWTHVWSEVVRNDVVIRLLSAVRDRSDPTPRSVPNKPANLIFGVEERPPHSVRWFSAVQQLAISSIYMIYPLIVAREAGLHTDQ